MIKILKKIIRFTNLPLRIQKNLYQRIIKNRIKLIISNLIFKIIHKKSI